MPFLQIGGNPGSVLFDQPSKDKILKYSKHQYRQQRVQHRNIGRIGHYADPKDIESRRAPYQTGQKQQRIPFYFHPCLLLMNNVQFPGYKIPTELWEF